MNNESNLNAACKNCRSHLADLLLDADYHIAHPELASHLRECATCGKELADLQATYALLDEYAAPEPSAYFDTKLYARLREAQAAEPEGLWERLKSFVLFSTGRSFRPAMSGALALVLAAGGAGVLALRNGQFTAGTVQASSTVNDLKVLDNNESAEQQMGELLDVSGSEDNDPQATT